MRSALMKRTVVLEASLCTIAYHGCGGGIESKRSALMQGCSDPAQVWSHQLFPAVANEDGELGRIYQV